MTPYESPQLKDPKLENIKANTLEHTITTAGLNQKYIPKY